MRILVEIVLVLLSFRFYDITFNIILKGKKSFDGVLVMLLLLCRCCFRRCVVGTEVATCQSFQSRIRVLK